MLFSEGFSSLEPFQKFCLLSEHTIFLSNHKNVVHSWCSSGFWKIDEWIRLLGQQHARMQDYLAEPNKAQQVFSLYHCHQNCNRPGICNNHIKWVFCPTTTRLHPQGRWGPKCLLAVQFWTSKTDLLFLMRLFRALQSLSFSISRLAFSVSLW